MKIAQTKGFKHEPKGSEAGYSDDGPNPTAGGTGPAPDEVLASQYRHITSGDYEAAYDLFDDGSRELVSLEEYSAFFESASPTK